LSGFADIKRAKAQLGLLSLIQRAEVREQRSEDRGQRAENRGQDVERIRIEFGTAYERRFTQI